jgi:hypothetical protein
MTSERRGGLGFSKVQDKLFPPRGGASISAIRKEESLCTTERPVTPLGYAPLRERGDNAYDG